MSVRIPELDFLKCVCILLMVAFHLVYIGDTYPVAKQIVYTFHMPAFLLLSGYLVNVEKDGHSFARSLWWVFVPYAVMETGYVLMSAVLPVRQQVDGVGVRLLLEKLFVAPMGPYWYLHTWLLCCATYYAVWRGCGRWQTVTRLVGWGVLLCVLSQGLGLMSLSNAAYFFAGALVRRSGVSFSAVFRPSAVSALAFAVLCLFPSNRERATLGGAAVTWCAVSFLIYLYPHVSARLRRLCCFVGRNTLSVLLFSPLFTILTRFALPWFTFDPSGMCFLCVSLCFVTGGSLAVTWLMDRVGVSPWFFGRKNGLYP